MVDAGSEASVITGDEVLGCVLAGGQSARMGRDKAALPFAGGTLLDNAVRRLEPQVAAMVISGRAGVGAAHGLPIIGDGDTGYQGPLAGILAVCRWAEHHRQAKGLDGLTHMATVAVDTPFFPQDLVARLADAIASAERGAAGGPPIVAMAASGGRHHPVFALWPLTIADQLAPWFAGQTDRSMRAFLSHCRAVTVDFDAGPVDPFFNVNTPDDLSVLEGLRPG